MTAPRLLLVALGSHGDIRPLLAIGAEAISRGGTAAILTNPHFEHEAASHGVRCIPFGSLESVRAWVSRRPATMHATRGPLTVLRAIIAPRTAALVRAVRSAIDDVCPDAVVAHQACIGARWASEAAGVPFVDVALSPCAWMNPRDTLSLTPWRGPTPTPRAVRFDVWMGRRITGWLSDGPLNDARRSVGLPPVRHVWFEELNASCLHLGLWSPAMRPGMPGDPPQAHVTGFARLETAGTGAMTEALRRFLDGGQPPVVVTLGTAVSHAHPEFHAMVVEALAETGLRAVLVTGDDDYAPKGLPPSIMAIARAPFHLLFPAARLAVHHGGIGTCAEAMVAGIPSLVLPAAHDQFDNASRCRRLGVARTLPLARATAKRLRSSILDAAADGSLQAKASDMGLEMQAESGAAAAVDAIVARVRGELTPERPRACRC
jgi:rhamnosyltransferase subunit B